MQRITLVRHGQSAANAGAITMPDATIPLAELGIKQARWLAYRLPSPAPLILVSHYQRAQQTAQPYSDRCAVPTQTHAGLCEFGTFDVRVIEGLTGEQRRPLVEAYWQAGDPRVRNGDQAETFQEFCWRVRAFMPVLDDAPDGTVVFGHGMWFAMLVWIAMGFETEGSSNMRAFRRFQQGLPMPNGAVYNLWIHAPSCWRVQANAELMQALADAS
jgi:broad specificity phosphatase PhoE